jgi:signal transduction histidine kinase
MVTAVSHAFARPAKHPGPIELITIATLVFVTAWGCIAISQATGRIAAIWVANAIVLAFILKYARRHWAAILTAALAAYVLANIAAGDNVVGATYFSLCDTIGVLAVALPLRALRLHRDFARPKSLLVFYALAIGSGPVIGSTMAGLYFLLVRGGGFLDPALDWYASDALGLVIVVPILLTVRVDALKAMFRRDQIATTLLLLGTMFAVIMLNHFARNYPLAFLFFPAVLLLTFQRSFEGGAIGLLMAGTYLLLPALVGDSSGTLHNHSPREQMTIVQVFIAVMGLSVMLVGAALEERKRLERGLAVAIRRAEDSREEALVAKDAAEQANRMKSMFLATMSHELRTPLNAVIGFSDVMHLEMLGPIGNARYREYTSHIHDAGKHLLDLINDILDMSKIEAGRHELHHEPVGLGELAHDCVGLMSERASQGGITLREMLPSGLTIEADARAIKQILLNLLSNAIKFTPPGGEVTTSVSLKSDIAVMSVKDTGVGIPADELYRLGNPFVQLRNDAGRTQAGTGLGLALVRALAEMHNGKLKIESVENVGTTVSVEIPLQQPEAKAA